MIGATLRVAGRNTASFVPYSALPYTYVPITDEGGTLPVEETFAIQPNYDTSMPDPVSNVSITMHREIVGFTAYSYATFTFVPPEDNYGGVVVRVKELADPDSLYRIVFSAKGNLVNSGRTESFVPGRLYVFSFSALNEKGTKEGMGLLVNNSGAGYLGMGDSTAPATPTGLVGSAKFGKLIWTWNKNPEADVAYYEAELNTSTAGGVLGKEIIPHLNDADYKPRYELEIQTGNLTSLITRALRVRAIDHSGNAGGWTSRIAASTGAVARGDAVDGDFTKKYSNSNITTQDLDSAKAVVTLSGVVCIGGDIIINASWQVRFQGSVLGGVLAGYEIQRNGGKINAGALTPSKVGPNWTDGVASVSIKDSPGAGTHTYRIWVYSTGTGSTATECRRAEITTSESRR